MAAETPANPLRIWALIGTRHGDNNQVLALAEALGVPFEVKPLAYNEWRRLHPMLLGASMRSLHDEARQSLDGDAPDLTLSIGHRSVPVVRALKARSGGRTLAVHIGNPRVSPRHFDLVITTPQYPVPRRANVMHLPMAIGRPPADHPPGQATERILAALPVPRRLLLLGGPTRYWEVAATDVADAVALLLRQSEADRGSLIVLPSPRTPAEVIAAADGALKRTSAATLLAPLAGPPSYAELLAAADRIFVTADSVSMVSESLRSGKPVGLVPIRSTHFGRLFMQVMDLVRPGRPIYPRDLRYFWRTLESQGLAGTIERPLAREVPDMAMLAAERIRQLLARQARQATAAHDAVRSTPANPA